MPTKLPDIQDTVDEIACPLCHGSGKTTGRIVLVFRDSILGNLRLGIEDALNTTKKVFTKRLWNAKKNAE